MSYHEETLSQQDKTKQILSPLPVIPRLGRQRQEGQSLSPTVSLMLVCSTEDYVSKKKPKKFNIFPITFPNMKNS